MVLIASGDKMMVVVMIAAVVNCHMNGSPIAHNPIIYIS
jgi:hypothetical protein